MASSLAAFHPTLPHAHPIRLSPARAAPTPPLASSRRARPRAAVRLAVSAASTSAPPPRPTAPRPRRRSRCASRRRRRRRPGGGYGSGGRGAGLGPVQRPADDEGGQKAFGAIMLEKAKLDLSQRRKKIMPELVTGGGPGDIGKRIGHGGGDDGDDGDDDDYFDDFDDWDEEVGLFRR